MLLAHDPANNGGIYNILLRFLHFMLLANSVFIYLYSLKMNFRHVAETCSFFKANSQLLTGSNNIERTIPRRNEACRACFSARKRLHPPIWAQPATARYVLCDCVSSEVIFSLFLFFLYYFCNISHKRLLAIYSFIILKC